jgi:demethylmenaquinone methyltransferase/2-methoxy-6-polyprenyl-1,4-benzoquinol methylase
MPLVRGQARTRRFFDLLAPSYDVVNTILFRPEWRAKVRATLLHGRVLDVGVGTGFTSADVAGAVGIDLSSEMVSRAKRYLGDLVLADAMSPPFRAGSFSTIVCAGSFYYLPDSRAALRGFHDLLRDGGRVVMLGPEAWFLKPLVRIFVRREYEALAGETGFEIVQYESLRGVASLVVLEKRMRRPRTSGNARGTAGGGGGMPRNPPA